MITEWEMLTDEQLRRLSAAKLTQIRNENLAALQQIQAQLGPREEREHDARDGDALSEAVAWRRKAKSALHHKLAFHRRLKAVIHEGCNTPSQNDRRKSVHVLRDLVEVLSARDLSRPEDARILALVEEAGPFVAKASGVSADAAW